jgi:hypothetical protein
MGTKVFLKQTPDAWQASTAYTTGSQILSDSGLYIQQVVTGGTSGGSLPSFSTVTGVTTNDGSVVWVCVGPVASGLMWLVPADWNNSDNTIECVGAGSNGGSNAPGGGGGGGAYSGIANLALTPGAYIPYSVGAAFTNPATPGGDTWFGATTYAASSVAAKGGQAGGVTGPALGGDPSLGIGTTRTGGGPGAAASGSPFTTGGGGGGGAGGPTGSGTPGFPNTGATGGNGGPADFGNPLGGGGGDGGPAGSVPSGGQAGGAGEEWQIPSVFPLLPAYGTGGGAGGGGVGQSATNGLGGNYGGGGGGGSLSASISAAGNGLLVITYAGLAELVVSCGLPPVATLGIPYSFAFPASGGAAPYTFSILSGSLPPGLALNTSTGVVSGTPTIPGAGYTYTIQVADSQSHTANTGACSGNVFPPPPYPPPPPPYTYAIAVSRCPPLDNPTVYFTATPSVPDIVYTDCYSTPAVMDMSYVDNPNYPHFTAFNRPRTEADERHLWKALRRAWDAADTVLKLRE